MLDRDWYKGREQTYIKHLVLKRYLQKLAFKKGWWGGDTISYVDCFAGPWRQTSEDLADTSPFIAIEELRQARRVLSERGRPPLKVRCLFIEKDRNAWALLTEKLKDVRDIEVEALLGEFEDHIDSIVEFTSGTFAFFFIDPTGWTGYPMDVISKILRHEPGEVLINFMTQFIARFIDDDRPEDIESFNRLFGSQDYRPRWADLSGIDREDEIIQAYSDQMKSVGGFDYTASTTILDPLSDRTHFHLIYATRHIEGLRVFRNEAERQADKEQKQTRWQAQRDRIEKDTGQLGLFDKPAGRTYSDEIRDRYRERAQNRIMELLKAHRQMPFDDLEEVALLFPYMNSGSSAKSVGKNVPNDGAASARI